MIYWCVFLPYFAFIALVAAGLHWGNMWVVAAGILCCFGYDTNPKLETLTKINTFHNCNVNIVQSAQKEPDEDEER